MQRTEERLSRERRAKAGGGELSRKAGNVCYRNDNITLFLEEAFAARTTKGDRRAQPLIEASECNEIIAALKIARSQLRRVSAASVVACDSDNDRQVSNNPFSSICRKLF